ncbi:MAG: hypothetical protein ABIP06_13385 [Pyrinomonadaceae bacterium]
MATKTDKTDGNENRQMRLNLTDLGKDDEKPGIVVTALDSNLQPLHTAEVDDTGNFDIPQKILDKAHRITVSPKTGKDEKVEADSVLTYRTAQFTELIQNGALNIAKANWTKWRFYIKCVTGRVRLCRRHPWWYYDLVRAATKTTFNSASIAQTVSTATQSVSISKFASLERVSPSLSELIYGPFNCHTICIGTVEVYRRTCCCKPWIINDLRLPELIRDLKEVIRVIPEIPRIPNLPDPPPEIEKAFFKDGTLNELAVNAPNDLAAIHALPKAEIAGYINDRPYLICRGYSCSSPVKVATGQINPNGRFNICWLDFPTILSPFCHREYTYIVKQKISGITYTIYNGVAANQWYESDEDVVLRSYSRYALSCRDNDEPGGGAFTLLDIIGDTESWNLKTPNAAGWDRVGAPAYNDGLVFPASSPAAALGANLNRNWGGTLKLNYKFSEDMKAVGARYYRISITEADNNGNPTGAREYLSDGLAWKKFVIVGTDIETQSENLGPDTVGGNANLFKIPYNADGAWLAGQYHGFLNTNDVRWNNLNKRHLVTVEVFDSAGARLRPTGTPATGLPGSETTANFTYRRRFQNLGATLNVPFAALTHMFWWDNRDFTALIEHLNFNGVQSLGECQFLVGGENSTFGIGYRAYHPNEMFQLSHSISWRRGLGSTSGTLLNSSSNNVGQPPALPGNSPTNTFHQMLHSNPSDPADPHKLKKCAFTVFLTIYSKTTDGDNFGNPSHQDTAAFALEIT